MGHDSGFSLVGCLVSGSLIRLQPTYQLDCSYQDLTMGRSHSRLTCVAVGQASDFSLAGFWPVPDMWASPESGLQHSSFFPVGRGPGGGCVIESPQDGSHSLL